ncbi:mitotic spindle checkpoint component mad2 [Protomyces lactucae-debilis]|uniref:Mitotic spindle checkpoint component mad2 n=1 Tax=Protomyces lactucae-debilis TaxID=2754530 RepID=A0A1Y2EZH9_PROLT|nr:mitotic spindle checkpoint component mad2 [Protomyces lactucae-debilis]ORY77032.1 mitotic spindle checkpoint component mad2 [Protomyces lactucae-debilis]
MAEANAAEEAPTRSTLPLKGSVKTVSEFFEYAINTILYQRGLYPPEDFKVVKKYGLNMLITTDDDVRRYIKKIMQQLHKWLTVGKVNKLVVCIVSKESTETLERWQFDVDIVASTVAPTVVLSTVPAAQEPASAPIARDEQDVTKEIQSLIRQITASVTFLPEISGRATFNVLVYTPSDPDPTLATPKDWVDSDARLVRNAEAVQLRSFSTGAHKVGLQVAYTMDEQVV